MHKTLATCLAIGFFIICGIIGLLRPSLGVVQSPERENFYQTIEEDALILKEQNGIEMHMKTIPQAYKILRKIPNIKVKTQDYQNYPKQISAESENECTNDNNQLLLFDKKQNKYTTTSVCDIQRRKDSGNQVVIITKDGRMMPVTDKENELLDFWLPPVK